MSKKIIYLDHGHGKFTNGKRTPPFPDGKQIREWEFNYPTVKKLGQLLGHNGFKVMYSSDTEKDTPLKDRVDKANKTKADLFVSIHYNALDTIWREDVGGIETFHYSSSNRSRKVADIIQKHLIAETGLKDRGVKSGNLYVLRKTKMPSILCECGFMDIKAEAKLMLNEEYQWKCARAIAKGICEYYGVKYKELATEQPKQLYRIRLSWDNSKSQIGAFQDLNTAIEVAKQNKDYTVYNKHGNQVYPEIKKDTNNNIKDDTKHWAYKYYENLNKKGFNLTETRFDDNITRGEIFKLLDDLTKD